MEDKVRLLRINKNKHRSVYGFPKEQKVFNLVRHLLLDLGFDGAFEWGKVASFGKIIDEETEKPIDEEEDIKNYNEEIINFSNTKYSVDIIFFSKNIYVIFNYRDDFQQEIAEALGKYIEEEN